MNTTYVSSCKVVTPCFSTRLVTGFGQVTYFTKESERPISECYTPLQVLASALEVLLPGAELSCLRPSEHSFQGLSAYSNGATLASWA